MKQLQANPLPQDYATYILDVLKPFDEAVTLSKRLVEVTATLHQIGCPDPSQGPGAHAFISFMMKARLYLKANDRVVDVPGEIVPLCLSSYINHQISTQGTGLTETNAVVLPSQVGKHALDTLIRYFQNHTEDEGMPDEERYRHDEELLFGMNAIKVIELLSASSALGIPPLVEICKAALERIKASGTASVPPLPPLEKVYPRLPVMEDEEDDQQTTSDSRPHHPSTRTATRTAFATASLTGLLSMGGNNSAEHRARLQSLLQARRKQEEGSEKRATAGPAANQKDVTERREDTRSLDELLSFLGVTEGQADGLTKKGQAKTQQASVPSKKKQNKMSERGKLQSKVKERPWEKTGTDSDSCSEKEVDIRQQQQGTSAAHQQPSDEGQLIHKEDDFSTGQSCSSEHDTAFSSTEISPTSNEEAWSSASIFKDLIPLFDSKSHLPMNSVLGSNILQPIIPSRPLPFAGTGRHRARLSALPQLEGEDEDEDT